MSVASPLRDLSKLTGDTKQQLSALATQFVREAELLPQPKDVVLSPKAPTGAQTKGQTPPAPGKKSRSR